MEKLKMDDYLFHSIRAHQEMYMEKRKPKEEAYLLKKTLEAGFIASRKYLREILTKNEYEFIERFTSMNWNGMNNVSIAYNHKSTLYGGSLSEVHSDVEDSPAFAYNHYVKKFPSIILNSILLQELSMRPEPYKKHIGEIQIEDKIPMKYFVGIALPNIKLNFFLNRVINCFDVLTDFENKMKLDFMCTSVEEFIKNYYQEVILFEGVLQETGSNLKLYHTETGEEILSSSNEIEYVRDLKKKLNS